MLLKLFGEIVDRHADVIHTDCGQSFYIVVDDLALPPDFEKRFRVIGVIGRRRSPLCLRPSE